MSNATLMRRIVPQSRIGLARRAGNEAIDSLLRTPNLENRIHLLPVHDRFAPVIKRNPATVITNPVPKKPHVTTNIQEDEASAKWLMIRG